MTLGEIDAAVLEHVRPAHELPRADFGAVWPHVGAVAVELRSTHPPKMQSRTQRRLRFALVAGILTALPNVALRAQPTPVTLDDPDVALLYPLSQRVQVMSELCLQKLPTVSLGVPAALEAWNTKHARQPLDALVNRTARRRAAMGRTIMRLTGLTLLGNDPTTACSNFGDFLATAEFDLGVANPPALSAARRKLGLPPETQLAVESSAPLTPAAGVAEADRKRWRRSFHAPKW